MDYSKLTVAQLKEELKKKGLSQVGAKAVLVQRLEEANAAAAPAPALAAAPAPVAAPAVPAAAPKAAAPAAVAAAAPMTPVDPAKKKVVKLGGASTPTATAAAATTSGAGAAAATGAAAAGASPDGPRKVKLGGSSAGAVDIESKKRRAEKFGVAVNLSESDKAAQRAGRFGSAASASGDAVTSALDSALTAPGGKKQKIAAGATPGSSPATAVSAADAEKIAKRGKKFGGNTAAAEKAVAAATTTASSAEDNAKAAARAARFSGASPAAGGSVKKVATLNKKADGAAPATAAAPAAK